MAKCRNISGEARLVPELGRVVEDEEVVTVPDDRLDGYLCQEGVWEEVAEAKTRKGRD